MKEGLARWTIFLPLPPFLPPSLSLTTSSMITRGISPLSPVRWERPQPQSSFSRLSKINTSHTSILQTTRYHTHLYIPFTCTRSHIHTVTKDCMQQLIRVHVYASIHVHMHICSCTCTFSCCIKHVHVCSGYTYIPSMYCTRIPRKTGAARTSQVIPGMLSNKLH